MSKDAWTDPGLGRPQLDRLGLVVDLYGKTYSDLVIVTINA